MRPRITTSREIYFFLALALSIVLISSFMTTHIKVRNVNAEENSNSAVSNEKNTPYIGVDVRGYHTSIQWARYDVPFPGDFYDKSFRLISKAGMNHIRYAFYWEAYESNPNAFMDELRTVAKTADKYNLNVIYDNHQFHTSSWLDPSNGTGFLPKLFDKGKYRHGAGGNTDDTAAKRWWSEWWNNKIKDNHGDSGWALQAAFLKTVASTVDNFKSTLGYEILNEPQVHSADLWKKIGRYNSYITEKLRKITNKTLVYSMNIPVQPNDGSKNLAKMAPENKHNVVFKFTIYDAPKSGSFGSKKLATLVKAAKIAKVPIYVGEWNDATHKQVAKHGKKMLSVDPKSNFEQNLIIKKFCIVA